MRPLPLRPQQIRLRNLQCQLSITMSTVDHNVNCRRSQFENNTIRFSVFDLVYSKKLQKNRKNRFPISIIDYLQSIIDLKLIALCSLAITKKIKK